MNRYSESQTKSAYRSPVYNVRAVPVEKVVANSYNPNVVAPPEMKLLELSIWEDGYTMPCVCYSAAEPSPDKKPLSRSATAAWRRPEDREIRNCRR